MAAVKELYYAFHQILPGLDQYVIVTHSSNLADIQAVIDHRVISHEFPQAPHEAKSPQLRTTPLTPCHNMAHWVIIKGSTVAKEFRPEAPSEVVYF